MDSNLLLLQWGIVLLSSLILFAISPYAKSYTGFFRGSTKEKKEPGFFLLTASLVISWIFAKSITNAANLGMSFGIVGGLSYAVYYLSFFVAGYIIYRLRVQGKFKSIHHFLHTKFGQGAVLLFSLAIGFRLWNEVWSNVIVIGQYFGDKGSSEYFIAAGIFTLLTLVYSLKGGLRSSLLTDMIQMILFGVLLVSLLLFLIPAQDSVKDFLTSGEWKLSLGLNLFFAALIQIFSYPFHDPVMTDRGFITDPKTTLKSFIVAGIIGFIIIVLFSFVGIYAKLNGIEGGDAAVMVSQQFGVAMMLMMNFIMVTSAASTLDSTFSSASKLAVVDLSHSDEKKDSVTKGRIAMIATAFFGALPLFVSPEIIKATTISGTMVIGLAPIFVLWKMRVPTLSFYLSLSAGFLAGMTLLFGWLPESLYFSTGKYADLLAVNIYGMILCFVLYFFPLLFVPKKEKMEKVIAS